MDRQLSEELDFLLSGAAWQDTLLQSYRSLHVTIQSILLAIAAGSFVALATLSSRTVSVACLVVLLLMWAIHRYAAGSFKAVVKARGEDVTWWHRRLLETERMLPSVSEMHFYRFKVFQKLKRDDSEHLQELIQSGRKPSDEELDFLVEKGLAHTRIAIDEQLFDRISLIWWAFLLLGGALFLYSLPI